MKLLKISPGETTSRVWVSTLAMPHFRQVKVIVECSERWKRL